MTTNFTAAALTVMMPLGLASLSLERAEAAPFSIRIDAETGANGPLGATLSGDTTSHTVSLAYDENNESANGFTFFTTKFSDASAMLSRSHLTTMTDPLGSTLNTVDFQISNDAFAYTVIDPGGLIEKRKGYTFDFTLFQQVTPAGQIYQYESLSGKTVLGSVYDAFASTTTATGNPLSVVPLPASLPLFGTALLAVAGAGYGWKRQSHRQGA